MANPFHNDPSRYSGDPVFNGFLRSRVQPLATLARPNPALSSSPGALHPLSHILNPAYDPPSDLYPTSLRNHSIDSDRNMDMSDNMGQRPPQLPSSSGIFEAFLSNGIMDPSGSIKSRNNRFFVPSYLQGSSYIQKLEEAHRALQSQREDEQQPASLLQPGQSTISLPGKGPTSHRGMKNVVIERAPPFEDDDGVAPLPTRWNREDKLGMIEVLGDGLELKLPGPRSTREHEHEVSGIRSDHPIPIQAGLYYYEVTVVPRKRDASTVCVGFSTKSVPLSRPPGWEPDSYGYHGDDGDFYSGASSGKKMGLPFGAGDCVGCGINFRTRTMFFTRNSVVQGSTAFSSREARGKIYPCIGAKKQGEHILVNFGQSEFMFDINSMMRDEQEKIQSEISKISISSLVSPPVPDTELLQQFVLQFLQHDGYVETARAFAEEMQVEKESLSLDPNTHIEGVNIKDDEDAHRRQRIRRAILEGDVDKALKYTNMYYPQVLEDHDLVHFRLKCRKFIEMIRRSSDLNGSSSKKSNGFSFDGPTNEMDVDENDPADIMETEESDIDHDSLTTETLRYGQDLQAEYQDDPRQEISKTLSEVFSLLAYPNPQLVKEMAPLLDRTGRVAVAEELNSAILSSLGKSSRSALESMYGQTSVLLDYLRENGGPGSFVNIQSVINDIPKNQPF